MKKCWGRIFVGVVGVLILSTLIFPHAAAAQGCALCYQSAASAGSRAIRALQNGIVVLIVPPFFICSAITYLVYRRRNSHNENT
jgi:hypothetical protein